VTENSIENDKNSNKKNEKITKIEKISNENSQNSNEKTENSNEKSEKILENSNIKSEKNSQNPIESEKISQISNESEKIPYYKRYYQKHKEEIKAKRLEKLKKAQEGKLEKIDTKENKLKPVEKVKVTAWQWTTEAILAIFILSLIAGIVVYKWWIKRTQNEGEQ